MIDEIAGNALGLDMHTDHRFSREELGWGLSSKSSVTAAYYIKKVQII